MVGISALSQEAFDRASPVLEEILAIHRTRGNDLGATQPLSAPGMIAMQGGDHERARLLLDESLAMLARYDDPWSRAVTSALLGYSEMAVGDEALAYARVAKAAVNSRTIENPISIPWVREGLAGVAAARGAWELAARFRGARDALHASLGLGMPPAAPAMYARTIAGCRDALGEEGFESAHNAAGHLAPEQALAKTEGVARAESLC